MRGSSQVPWLTSGLRVEVKSSTCLISCCVLSVITNYLKLPSFCVMMVFKEEDPFSRGICGSHPSLIRTMCDTLKWCCGVQVLSVWKHHCPNSSSAQDTESLIKYQTQAYYISTLRPKLELVPWHAWSLSAFYVWQIGIHFTAFYIPVYVKKVRLQQKLMNCY